MLGHKDVEMKRRAPQPSPESGTERLQTARSWDKTKACFFCFLGVHLQIMDKGLLLLF